jgi:hypothetical protein
LRAPLRAGQQANRTFFLSPKARTSFGEYAPKPTHGVAGVKTALLRSSPAMAR